MVDKPKPLITANQVTAVRLLAMPLLAWLLYQGRTGWWWALAVGFVVGSTDFVDGLLARKYGPTVLGGMMDPLADKVFVALGYLPLMDLGFFPPYAVALLFVREFMVTSMRSAYEWRGLQLKTSFLGKMKTWVQMQGMAMFMLAGLISRDLTLTLCAAAAALPAVVVVVFFILKRRILQNGVIGSAFMLLAFAIFYLPNDLKTSIDISVWIICGVTWVSGLDYLVGGLPKLKEAGGFHRADLVRLLGSIFIPIAASLALIETESPTAPILAIIAMELAVGGLDNLLSRHKAKSSALLWGLRTLGAPALLLATLFLDEQVELLTWTAFVISIVLGANEFWRGRDHYLDDDKWDEELVSDEE